MKQQCIKRASRGKVRPIGNNISDKMRIVFSHYLTDAFYTRAALARYYSTARCLSVTSWSSKRI